MQPEKLNLWDRFFNRYRKEVHDRGTENWITTYNGVTIEGSNYSKDWIEYKIIDRVTGGYTIEREYLN